MSDNALFYDTHVFCCVNERRDGHPRGCCAEKGSGGLRDYMKKRANYPNLYSKMIKKVLLTLSAIVLLYLPTYLS